VSATKPCCFNERASTSGLCLELLELLVVLWVAVPLAVVALRLRMLLRMPVLVFVLARMVMLPRQSYRRQVLVTVVTLVMY
jgi:hypothetical protein